jgi:SagB-type dehydrogenase family enzyme
MTRSVRSAALEYHEATNVAAGGTNEDEERFVGARPPPFKDYGDPERLPLDTSVAGPLLQRGAGIVRSQDRRDYGGGTIHWRAYSSAGALYPVEAYVAVRGGLFSFDALERSLVRVGADVRAAVAQAAAEPALASAEAIVVLTGIHARTGWKYLERGYRHVWWDAGTMLANLLALAAADGLRPRLYTAFVDRELNTVLGIDGVHEYALALLALGEAPAASSAHAPPAVVPREAGRQFERAERLHRASSLEDASAVLAWRSGQPVEEPRLDAHALDQAIRRRRSIRAYAREPLALAQLAELLEWSEAPIPADALTVVRQLVTVASVGGLAPGIYDAELRLLRAVDQDELRDRAGFAAMEQEHPRDAAVNVFQLASVDSLDDRGYRWAQLEAGIRAGRLQVGAFMRGWGAAASTFYDDEVSQLLETDEAPMLMVSIGPRSARPASAPRRSR